jgi:hypothetical protein
MSGTWWAWLALGLFFLGFNGTDALLGLHDGTLPAGAVFLLRFVSLFLTWQWLEVECRPFRQRYPLDMGMFLYAAGLWLIPYYMWRNQRWRGLLKVVGLVAMWLATYLVAAGGAFVLRTIIGE